MSLQQLDLFAPAPLVPGLRTAENFLAPDEQADLTARIDAQALSPFQFHQWEGKRLTASFGYAYDFVRGRVLEALPLPHWLLPLRERAAAFAGVQADDFVQALLIRYDPGAGIGWHRDRPQFGKVVGLSLGAAVTMRLRRRAATGFERRALPLLPDSIYLLDGEVRREWEHSIAPVAGTRRSITFRTLA
jgi:alkylated DNA repair protein (DNA oxidative demethylase)